MNSKDNKNRFSDDISDKEMDDILKRINTHVIPDYLSIIYDKYYLNPRYVNFLDNNFIATFLSCFQKNKLEKTYLNEFSENDKALQIGNVYGSLIQKLANKVTKKGCLDIIDIIPYQLHKVEKKLQTYKNVDMWLQDAKTPLHREYNTIGLYFVLHESPDNVKKHIIESLLKHIDEFNSKVVFIDYHYPHPLNPFQGIYKLINAIYEPYAKSLSEKEIWEFTPKHSKYFWDKKTLFGGIYQKVTVTKKHDDEQ